MECHYAKFSTDLILGSYRDDGSLYNVSPYVSVAHKNAHCIAPDYWCDAEIGVLMLKQVSRQIYQYAA